MPRGITVLMGSEEDFTVEDAECWKEETEKEFELRILAGGHFFVFDHTSEIQKVLKTLFDKDES